MENPRIGIIIGTTREGRFGDRPVRWIFDIASGRTDLDFELMDLRDYTLPLFDEVTGSAFVPPENEAALRWGEKMARFVGYGGVCGACAIEQLRLVCIELQMAPTRNAVHTGMEPYFSLPKSGRTLSGFDFLNQSAAAMLDELAWWTHTPKAERVEAREPDKPAEHHSPYRPNKRA